MKKATLILLATALTYTTATALPDSLKVDTTLNLSGVTVKGMRTINKVDRQVLLPTKAMKRSAGNGYELL